MTQVSGHKLEDMFKRCGKRFDSSNEKLSRSPEMNPPQLCDPYNPPFITPTNPFKGTLGMLPNPDSATNKIRKSAASVIAQEQKMQFHMSLDQHHSSEDHK